MLFLCKMIETNLQVKKFSELHSKLHASFYHFLLPKNYTYLPVSSENKNQF